MLLIVLSATFFLRGADASRTYT